MSIGQEKREKIFDIYVGQLRKLKDLDLIPSSIDYEEGLYLCPICLGKFSKADLVVDSVNMLTLEDAPPKSLGGKANTLTCKSCNNRCGHDIDFHLTEKLIELDARSFLPNTKSQAKLTHNGITIRGEIEIDDNGSMSVVHDLKNNHPAKFDSYIKTIEKDDIVNLEFKPSRVDIHRFEVALLKTAYILAFELYGYALIFNSSYNIVREQLINTNSEIYPEGFWTKQKSFRKEHEGVHLIVSKGFEGFQAIFNLKTKVSENRFGVYLPISEGLTKKVVDILKVQEGGFGLKLDPLFSNDYFANAENIKLLADYMRKINTP